MLAQPTEYEKLFWMHKAYQKGMLPNAGGIYDQPSKLIECIRVMDRALAMAQEDIDKREKIKLEREKRKQQQTR